MIVKTAVAIGPLPGIESGEKNILGGLILKTKGREKAVQAVYLFRDREPADLADQTLFTEVKDKSQNQQAEQEYWQYDIHRITAFHSKKMVHLNICENIPVSAITRCKQKALPV